MGGGDLNLKKSWHPSTLRNIERVWKAEQKHEVEKQKIEQLQKELAEERAREEIQAYAEDQGVVKKREERLDWMYQGPAAMVNRDDYLLGRKIDKTLELLESQEKGTERKKDDYDVGATMFSSQDLSGTATVDLANKIREDPLFNIMKKEKEQRKNLLSNPVKMKQLQQMLQDSLHKGKGKKSKKHRKHEDSDSDEKKFPKKHKKDKHHKHSSSESEDERMNMKEEAYDFHGQNKKASPEEDRYERKGFSSGYQRRAPPPMEDRCERKNSSSSYLRKPGSPEEYRYERNNSSSSYQRKPGSPEEYRYERNNSCSSYQRKPALPEDDRYERKGSSSSYQRKTDSPKEERYERKGSSSSYQRRAASPEEDRYERNSFSSSYQRKTESSEDRYERKSSSSSYQNKNHSNFNSSDSNHYSSKHAYRNSESYSSRGSSHLKSYSKSSHNREDYQEKDSNGQKRKLDAAERDRLLKEMQQNAKWRDEQRERNFKRYKEDEEKETGTNKMDPSDFIKPLLSAAAAKGSLENRVKQRIFSIQKGSGHMDKHFARR